MNLPYSLRVTASGRVLFESDGRWLHPLLDFTEAVETGSISTEGITIDDKIIGKAASLLIVRLEDLGVIIDTVHAGIMSKPAAAVFRAKGISHSHDTLVARIDCQTEELLADIDAPDAAYGLITERAGRSRRVESLETPSSSAPTTVKDGN